MTAANADEWLRNAPGTEGAARARDAQGDRGRGPAGARAPISTTLRAAVARRRRRRPPRRPRASPPRRSSTSPTTSPRRKAGLGARRRRGRDRRRRPPRRSSRSTCSTSALGAVGKPVRFGADSPLGKVSPYADMVALTAGDGGGRDRGADPGRRQSGLRDAAQVGLRRGARQGAARREPREPAQRDHRAGAPGAARRCTRSSPGATTRPRTASSGSCSRRWGPCRSTASRSTARPPATSCCRVGRQALGLEDGQGAAQVGELRGLRQGRVAEARARTTGRGSRSRISGKRRSGAAASGAPAPRRGGRAPPGGRGASRPPRRSSRATASHALIVYPVARFYDGRGADQPWLQEAPDTMTQVAWDCVGRDSGRDRRRSSGSSAATWSR